MDGAAPQCGQWSKGVVSSFHQEATNLKATLNLRPACTVRLRGHQCSDRVTNVVGCLGKTITLRSLFYTLLLVIITLGCRGEGGGVGLVILFFTFNAQVVDPQTWYATTMMFIRTW